MYIITGFVKKIKIVEKQNHLKYLICLTFIYIYIINYSDVKKCKQFFS